MDEEDDEQELEALRAAWTDGGSAQPLIEALLRRGRMDEAAVMARLLLGQEDCQDREWFERALARTGQPPPGWSEALTAFASAPSIEAWDALMRFTPARAFYHRVRHAVRYLQQLGTDPNILFRCATRVGTTPDGIALAQSGAVHPDTIVARAMEAPALARAFWFGLAAEAACVRGDDLSTMRLLKRAYAGPTCALEPKISAMMIRQRASAQLHEMLDRAGIPRFDEV